MNTLLETAWNDIASKLRGYVRARVRDHAAAEDILQDVYLKALMRSDQLKSDTKIDGWLFFIARNAVIDYYRKQKSSEELPHDLAAEPVSSELENAGELRNAFLKMIHALPEPYREALILTEFEGMTQKELGEKLGISLSGAKSRVQRAREKLKHDLLECCRLEFDRRGGIVDCTPRDQNCCSDKDEPASS